MRTIIYAYIILGGVISGCQVLNAPNAPATLSAQNTVFAAEATSIPRSLEETAVALAGTASVAETNVAEISSINRQLIATMNAIVPATAAPQVAPAPIFEEGQMSEATSNSLVELAVTGRKRDSDGCADGTQSLFAVDTPIIYATTRAPNITAGSVVAVEWKYQDQIVGSGSYTLSRDETNFCIWFPLDPARNPFTPGSWSVQFSVNNNLVGPTVFFTIGTTSTP